MESVDFGQHENQANQLALTEQESNSVQGALFMRHWELIQKRMNTTGYLRGAQTSSRCLRWVQPFWIP
jgi:hypothetical protein